MVGCCGLGSVGLWVGMGCVEDVVVAVVVGLVTGGIGMDGWCPGVGAGPGVGGGPQLLHVGPPLALPADPWSVGLCPQ